MKEANFRVGLGQDSHPVKKINNKSNKPLILGGVLISDQIEITSESDGDVIIHALCNALNTAVGLGSLSLYATKMCQEGVKDSREYLKKAMLAIKSKGYRVDNVSIAVETSVIRLEEFGEKMKTTLALILKIDKDDIGIAFTTGENLTAFGKGEGIQVLVSVLTEK